jgi:serine/threonine protein kinase
MNPADDLPPSPPTDALEAGLAAAFGPETGLPTVDLPGKDERVGSILAGKYKLIEPIGQGGMGNVFMAQQSEPVKRVVAVKVIKAGMDSHAVLARFEAERQALAMMDHPNIAKVLDAGTTERGRPYFVMELVKGTPITTFADARKLSLRERLQLFIPVCSAIQHAHMKGIIHRDIKPSNVLVALYDDRAVPKVIDFGIAKATGQALTDKTLMTGFGAVVGTPEYMSPEQASLNNLDIDTRSDVYSLGVLLYELLTGSPPFSSRELKEAGLLEILRVVREEEIPRPSIRLSTAAAKPSIAANRGIEPVALGKILRSELDWLVMKALEKDRKRRYESANGFAADVERYLAGEAVTAVPPSLGYRTRKWVRKNKALVFTSVLVGTTFAVGFAGTVYGLLRAEQEARRANNEADQAKAARETAERNLVNSYLRPLGYNTNNVDPAEYVALAELSANESESIKLLFLEEALADGERAMRVARRADLVIQAAVGPSRKRREVALELCRRKQKDKDADPRVRLCACWLAAELGEVDVDALNVHFETLGKQKDSDDWKSFLDCLLVRIKPEQTAATGQCLIELIGKSTDRVVMGIVTEALTALAPKLDASISKSAADAFIIVIGKCKSTEWQILNSAGDGLAALALKHDPTTRKLVWDTLIRLLRKYRESDAFHAVKKGVVALAPQLDAATTKGAADALINILGKSTDSADLYAASQGLAALASRLDVATTKTAADVLIALLGKSTDELVQMAAGEGLASLAPNLDAAMIKAVTEGILSKSDQRGMTNSLTSVAPLLDPKLGKSAITTLIESMKLWSSVEYYGTKGSTSRVIGVIVRKHPHLANVTALSLIDLLGKKDDDYWPSQVAIDCLGAISIYLDQSTAESAFSSLYPLIGNYYGTDCLKISDTLAKVMLQMESEAAKKATASLLAILNESANLDELRTASECLAGLAPKLAPTLVKEAAETISNVFRNREDRDALRAASLVLASLAPSLDSQSAKSTTDALFEVLGKTMESDALHAAVDGLTALTPRLDAATIKTVADALMTILGNSSNSISQHFAAERLVALAPRLDAATIKTAADALITVLRTTESFASRSSARDRLAVLAPSLTETDFQNEFSKLAELFDQSTDDALKHPVFLTLIATVQLLNQQDRESKCQSLLISLFTYERQTRIITYDYGEELLTIEGSELTPVLRQINSISFLVSLLKEPACIGSYREAILNRLDELAYPNPAYDASINNQLAPFATVLGPLAAPALQAERFANRKFRTLHDATAWLAEHHPEIDLDKPYSRVKP